MGVGGGWGALRIRNISLRSFLRATISQRQSAGSMLTALITLHPEEASGWNITVIVATFPEGVADSGGLRGGVVQWPIGLVEKQLLCRRERGVHVHTLHAANAKNRKGKMSG